MTRRPVAIFVLVIAIAAPIVAAADCARDAAALRVHLVEQARRARRWNLGWAVAFGVAAVGQFTLAIARYNPLGGFDRDYEEMAYVGGIQATIGLASRIVTPLGVDLPHGDGDRCVELAGLRASLTSLAKNERRTFWLTHLGGLALNLAGASVLWSRRSFSVGGTSFLTAFPVGLASAYTMPRDSWHLWREQRASWSVALAPRDDGWSLSVTGPL